MSYRGTLKQCISAAFINFTSNHYQMLCIVHNPTGKYYTLMTPEKFKALQTLGSEVNHRLVFEGTFRELAIFAEHQQLTLFKESPSNDSPQADTTGQ